jgi:hypothetical protein
MEILENKLRTESSLRWILAAACLAFATPGFAQQVKFVVTGPVFNQLTPNTGFQIAPFTVLTSTGATVPFVVISSRAALAISSSANAANCVNAKPAFLFGTGQTPLYACIDTTKLVPGRYAFLLKIRYGTTLKGVSVASVATDVSPEDVSPAECTPSGSPPETRVAVNVTVTGGANIKIDTPTVILDSDNLQRTFSIDYVSSASSSAAISSLVFDPATPAEGSWIALSSTCGQTAFTTSCLVTVTANPFKLIGAKLGDVFTSTLPVVSIGGASTENDVMIKFTYSRRVASQIFPHIADAGLEWQTDFRLDNPTSCPVSVDLVFHLDSPATRLSIVPNPDHPEAHVSDTGITNITVPAMGFALFSTPGPLTPDLPLVSGWVEIVSPAQISGLAKFTRHASHNGQYYQGSVPLTLPVASFSLPYDSTQDSNTGFFFQTGLAIANPDSTQIAQFTCTDDLARTVTVGPPGGLNGFGHFGQVLGALNTPARRGTVMCTSTSPVGVLGLSFLGVDAFSSVPFI